MPDNDIGYHQDPRNGKGILRARTTKQIRSWEIPKAIRTLESLNEEFGGIEFPGIYILFEGKNKVYIGEAKNIYNRLKTHMVNPEDKIKNWERAIVINDGRPATQSDFNDAVVRKALELYLITLFKANKYTVLAQGEPQKLNAPQKYLVDSLTNELNFSLLKKNIISKILEGRGQEEIFGDELKNILTKRGKNIQEWGKYEAAIEGEKVFIRPGSKKPRGWQITFRGRKPGSFIDSLQRGNGYLLVSRDGVLLIPLTEVQRVITDRSTYEQDTIDIWIAFTEEKVMLRYKDNEIDVTNFRLIE
ncbi:MAG TPA: GIY-YIG nuclease family protein [Candidatus Avalokitesvara rifleensis]|uniref:GIY-YIG nuclease family protein n=1 Tax=Candidatus Avalokitesvara rifleensis TaxID=3367620 RepID=UPI0027143451|nr:GIY-YIG nuclease family protein [Candidatus Brocadiales bacterium]